MNAFVLLPLLAAAVFGAPAPKGQHFIAAGHPAPVITYAQVPLQKNIHYEVKPVITGYQTTILKPAIGAQTFAHIPAALPAPALPAAPAFIAADAPAPPPPAPAPAAPVAIESDTIAIENAELRSAVPLPPPAAPAPAIVAALPAPGIRSPSIYTTQEDVLAPVRTNTHITPQITRIEPEIHLRKIVHDVPVATPVLAAQPVLQYHY